MWFLDTSFKEASISGVCWKAPEVWDKIKIGGSSIPNISRSSPQNHLVEKATHSETVSQGIPSVCGTKKWQDEVWVKNRYPKPFKTTRKNGKHLLKPKRKLKDVRSLRRFALQNGLSELLADSDLQQLLQAIHEALKILEPSIGVHRPYGRACGCACVLF